jgi:hypothetical protein
MVDKLIIERGLTMKRTDKESRLWARVDECEVQYEETTLAYWDKQARIARRELERYLRAKATRRLDRACERAANRALATCCTAKALAL